MIYFWYLTNSLLILVFSFVDRKTLDYYSLKNILTVQNGQEEDHLKIVDLISKCDARKEDFERVIEELQCVFPVMVRKTAIRTLSC